MKCRTFIVFTTALASLLLVACGGGGSKSRGGVYFTHKELADEFVYRAFTDKGIDLSIVKYDTLQRNFIVTYDQVSGKYKAINLTGYNPGEDVSLVLNDPNNMDVKHNGLNVYTGESGKVFHDENQPVTDLELIAALDESDMRDRLQKNMKTHFGLSASRSGEVATATLAYIKLDRDSITAKDADILAEKILGSSITAFKKAGQQMITGDESKMKALIKKAAATNDVSVENAKAIINNHFGVALEI